jgi:hypothetical protein
MAAASSYPLKRREALRRAYFGFLKGRAGNIETEQPEAYSAFLAKAAEERREIEANRIYKPKLKERLLSGFDHEESHLERLREYFHELTLEEWLDMNSEL